MKTALIIHGVGGHPGENWFPWLKEKLEEQGYQVFIPQFPTPENQTREEWLKVLSEYKEHLNKDCILIGHSLGPCFILNALEIYPAKAAFFVSGFIGEVNNEFNESMKSFAQRDFDWDKIKSNCEKFYIFHAENDSYLEPDKAERIAKNLHRPICLHKNSGHFNQTSGFTEFPELLNCIISSEKQ